jgi:hypothetical protein
MIRRAFTLACPLAIIGAVVFAPNIGLGQVNSQEWVEIGSARDRLLFVDLGSMRQRQNKPTGWILTYHATPDFVRGRSIAYRAELYQADCGEDSIGSRNGTNYARGGEVVETFDLGYADLNPVVPGSLGESILNAICRRDQSIFGPTQNQVTQRLNLRKHRNADGTALLPDGEWAVSSDGQFYQVVNRIWTGTIRPNLSDAAVAPPIGLKRFAKGFRFIELTSDGWVYDDERRRPVPTSELELSGVAWIDVDGVESGFLIREGRYFNRIHHIGSGFEEGDVEIFGGVFFKFNGSQFVRNFGSFPSISSALEYARQVMPPVNRPPANRPASKQKKR